MYNLPWIQLLFLLLITLCTDTSCSSTNESVFLRRLANTYSPSLVVSFLKTRITYDKEMIGKIKNLTVDLDPSRRDLFDLGEKFNEIMIDQLTSLGDTDYFDISGKDKVAYYTEQFILQNELYPIGFGSYGVVKVPLTPDDLLARLNGKSQAEMVNEAKALISTYIADIESKESNASNNIIQKLSIALTKTKLKSLIDYNYSSDSTTKTEIEQNLRKLKVTTDFFYSQYDQLSSGPMSNL